MAGGLEPAGQLGVTPPISSTLPTTEELRLNESLVAELRDNNNFEATEDTEKRKRVLTQLQRVTMEFVRLVGRKKGLAPSVIEAAGGKVSTFGSYRLGVYGPGSDIDALVVAPKHVDRDDFFENFPLMLEKMSGPGAIEEMTPVRDAHVPIIKLEYSGISIDLIFTRLAVASVPESLDLKDKTLLRGLDDTELRSINGTRVTDEILNLVPQVKSFRHALRAIKLWAQRRAIYGNVVGFPGGVAWAMLVARICQLYPMACGATIVTKFFHLMMNWPWPRPVLLKSIEDGPLKVRVWNPQIYPGDKRHLMPIITPAYPSMCATHNISHSTKAVIQRELGRGANIANAIASGKLPWKALFEKHSFFTNDYKYYLSIVAASRTKDAQQIWTGLVQSKVRRLVTGIDLSGTGVDLAHPYTKGFERVHLCKTEEEVDKVFQGDLQYQLSDEKIAELDTSTDKSETSDGTTSDDKPIIVHTTTYYIGLEMGNTGVGKRLDITNPVADFKRQCTEWAQYNPELNSLRTLHTRNYDLPLDVFEEGEKRPLKAKSKKVKNSKSSARRVESFNAGTPPTDPNTPESRKRKSTVGSDDSATSKKNANETNGVKRALDEEDAELNGAKRPRHSVVDLAATPAA